MGALTGDLDASSTAPRIFEDESDAPPSASQRERWLLVLAGIIILLNQAGLVIVREQSPLRLWPVLVWTATVIVGQRLLDRTVPTRDPVFFPLIMFLTGWSINLVTRLVPSYTMRQTLWLVVVTAALVAVTALPGDLRWLRRYRYTWLIGGLLLLAVTILVGENPSGGGPRLWLWLRLGRVYYQPSELLKIVLVVFLASYLAEHQPYLRSDTLRIGSWRVPSPAFLGPVLLMWGLCVVVLVWQRDLGAATLFFAVFMAMLYVASGQATLLIGGGVLLLLAAAAAYASFELVALRANIWWNPWPTASADAYQVVQSLMAVAAGGLFGQGIGQGFPAIIPVAHSDFAFAAIAEEWGLLGTLTVLVALAVLVVRGMRVAVQAEQPFRVLLAAGLSTMLGMQSLLIMGGVLKLVPLTGVTLPFLSYGGSSLLSSFVMIGLLMVMSADVRNGQA